MCVCMCVETHGREPTPAMPCGFVALQLMVSNGVSWDRGRQRSPNPGSAIRT